MNTNGNGALHVSTRFCLTLNRLTPKALRPRLRGRVSPEEYFDEQYRDGPDALRVFHNLVRLESQRVLDLGCGLGGKTCYFARQGAAQAIGIDKDPTLIARARILATEKGPGNVEFLVGDAKKLPLGTDSVDVVIMTDVMEHIPRPNIELALIEALRVLRPGGRLFLHFPPWTCPLAGHLYDVLWFPWCHLMFSDEILHEALAHLGAPEQHGSLGYWEHFQELNRITIEEFCSFLPSFPATPVLLERTTFGRFFGPVNLARVPVFGKYFTRHVVCILEKQPEVRKPQ